MTSLACAECSDCFACDITSCSANSDCVVSWADAFPHDEDGNSSFAIHHRRTHVEARLEQIHRHGRPAPPLNYCCACSRSGATWLIGNVYIDLGIFVLSGTAVYQLLANIIFGQLHFQLAACGCCQRARHATRKKWYIVAWSLMGITAPVILFSLPFFIRYAVY